VYEWDIKKISTVFEWLWEKFTAKKSTFGSKYIHFRIESAWPVKSGFTLALKIRGESAGEVSRRVDNAQTRDSKFYKIIPFYVHIRGLHIHFSGGISLWERVSEKGKEEEEEKEEGCSPLSGTSRVHMYELLVDALVMPRRIRGFLPFIFVSSALFSLANNQDWSRKKRRK